jgi:hypothetical protein
LKDRLFTTLCVLAAAAIAVIGISRGNLRAGLVGAALFLGYAVLHGVTRRLVPTARMLTGSEADERERLAQFRATRLAGQVALGLAAVGVVLALTAEWQTGLWVAGSALAVVVAFTAGLWVFGRTQ